MSKEKTKLMLKLKKRTLYELFQDFLILSFSLPGHTDFNEEAALHSTKLKWLVKNCFISSFFLLHLKGRAHLNRPEIGMVWIGNDEYKDRR
jgi:hypothetical protein